MTKLYFYTQEYENYGTPDEPYWKAKGGSDFIIEASEWTEEMIETITDLVTFTNPMYESSLIGYQEVCAEFKTDFEQSQFEYEGFIQYPATRATYEEFVAKFEEVV